MAQYRLVETVFALSNYRVRKFLPQEGKPYSGDDFTIVDTNGETRKVFGTYAANNPEVFQEFVDWNHHKFVRFVSGYHSGNVYRIIEIRNGLLSFVDFRGLLCEIEITSREIAPAIAEDYFVSFSKNYAVGEFYILPDGRCGFLHKLRMQGAIVSAVMSAIDGSWWTKVPAAELKKATASQIARQISAGDTVVFRYSKNSFISEGIVLEVGEDSFMVDIVDVPVPFLDIRGLRVISKSTLSSKSAEKVSANIEKIVREAVGEEAVKSLSEEVLQKVLRDAVVSVFAELRKIKKAE